MAQPQAPNKPKAAPGPKKRSGLYTVFAGIGVLILGYICLAKGSITVAPILIIGSFVVMGAGIFIGWD